MNNNTLHVIWFVPPAVAIAASWKASAEVQLQSRQTSSSDEQFEALSSGAMDAAVTSMDNVLHWNLRPGPQDFVIVAQVESTTPLSLIGRSKVQVLQDLEGASILVDAPENGFVIALRALLGEAGLARDAYSLVPVGGVKERFQALVDGRGDATLLGPPFDSLALAQGLVTIAGIQAAYPLFPGQGVVVRRTTLLNNPALNAWIALLAQAVRGIGGKLDKLESALASQSMPASAIKAMIDTFPTTLVPSVQGIELLIAHRKQLGLLGAEASYASLVDTSLLK